MEEQKMVRMWEAMNGPLSRNCEWEFDYEDHSIICIKDGRECWRVSREELIFEWVTKDL